MGKEGDCLPESIQLLVIECSLAPGEGGEEVNTPTNSRWINSPAGGSMMREHVWGFAQGQSTCTLIQSCLGCNFGLLTSNCETLGKLYKPSESPTRNGNNLRLIFEGMKWDNICKYAIPAQGTEETFNEWGSARTHSSKYRLSVAIYKTSTDLCTTQLVFQASVCLMAENVTFIYSV